jgi:hypothetical protein
MATDARDSRLALSEVDRHTAVGAGFSFRMIANRGGPTDPGAIEPGTRRCKEGSVATWHVQSAQLAQQFASAVASLDRRFSSDPTQWLDENLEREARRWLDQPTPLPWASSGITADEWFFITTLYGEMTLDGQRTHIRTFFPRFVQEADRYIRRLSPELVAGWRLRSARMKTRLCRMAEVLRERGWTMTDYVRHLRELEHCATPSNPMPALEAIRADHRATGWKTLSVFVRDCVGGNCFPIDTRVAKEPARHNLPSDEPLLVGLALGLGRNPRQVARVFYQAGGE